MKVSKKGLKDFVSHFERLEKTVGYNDPFQQSEAFRIAYLTDYFNDLTYLNVPVHCHPFFGGWHEVDNEQDYEHLKKSLEKRSVQAS